MKIDVLTLFPGWFDRPLGESILARAQERGLLALRAINFRDYATGRHATVDDTPYGGGGGMVLKPEPLAAAIDAVAGPPGAPARAHVILTSPQGPTFTQARAKQLAQLPHLVLICGHYEGVDERIIETRVDEELSIGDYVLTGGEPAALVILDAISRMIPGVLGNPDSAPKDSFYNGLLDCPHYTRPEVFEGRRVPEVLLSGHHGRIEQWRRERMIEKTRRVRPELLAAAHAAGLVPELDPPKPRKRRRPKSAEAQPGSVHPDDGARQPPPAEPGHTTSAGSGTPPETGSPST